MRTIRVGETVEAGGVRAEVVAVIIGEASFENLPWDAVDADVAVCLADGRIVSGDKVKKISSNHNTKPKA